MNRGVGHFLVLVVGLGTASGCSCQGRPASTSDVMPASSEHKSMPSRQKGKLQSMARPTKLVASAIDSLPIPRATALIAATLALTGVPRCWSYQGSIRANLTAGGSM